jgi:hypothetical protein
LVKYGEKLKINRFLACSYTVEGEDPAGKRLDGRERMVVFLLPQSDPARAGGIPDPS